MTGLVQLTAPGVNSGSAVVLHGVSVRYTWKNLTNSEPSPGKFAIVESDVAGFENPMIVLNGVIDVDQDSTTAEFLKDFAKIEFDGTTATAIKLEIAAGSTPVYLKDATGVDNFVYVIVQSMTLTFNTNTDEGARWDYTINFKETDVT